jgi:hypothetical protein
LVEGGEVPPQVREHLHWLVDRGVLARSREA